MGTTIGGFPTPSGAVAGLFSGVKTYDASLVQVIVGVFPIIGFAPDSVVRIERSAPTYKKVVGIYGEVTRVLTRDLSGTMTITLAQTSESNILLTTLQYADELGTFAVYPIFVIDLSGLSTYLSTAGWIRKPPDSDLRRNIDTRTWVFDLATSDIANLGNLALAPGIF